MNSEGQLMGDLNRVSSEMHLILDLKRARENLAQAKEEVERLEKIEAEAEHALLEYLENAGATKTATYHGLGSATALKPRLYANYTEENFPTLAWYLESVGRTDLIKEKIMPSSLSSYVQELLESGKEPPPGVTYYLKKKVKLNLVTFGE